MFLTSQVFAQDAPIMFEDTWANWEKRLDRAHEGVEAENLPGRCVGIVVPSDAREDLLPMSALGYATLMQDRPRTVVFLMPAPKNYELDGLAMPGVDAIDISMGRFVIDSEVRGLIQNSPWPVKVDPDLFLQDVPRLFQNQLANIKYLLKANASKIKILPIYVKFSEPKSQVKDYAPYLAELLKDARLDGELGFVVLANLSRDANLDNLLRRDNQLLTAFRSQDVDTFLTTDLDNVATVDLDTLSLGLLTMRILSSDHAEILAYAQSSQLVLTKDKSITTSFVSVGFASAPPIRHKTPHFNREKLVVIFDELNRSDILTMTRQTCASILDTTAAKPPSLTSKEAAKKWPVYVSLYGPEGNLAGQSGSHVAIAPLEESLRKYSGEAVTQALPQLNKSNFNNYVVDVSIPYGFARIQRPEELVPMLNGVIVHQRLKTSAFHPDAWRKYPDPHQLLASICVRLGLKPWAYATGQAKLESFRILSFNEKEPFQDLGASIRKKKKKKAKDEGAEDGSLEDSGGGGDGGSPFSF